MHTNKHKHDLCCFSNCEMFEKFEVKAACGKGYFCSSKILHIKRKVIMMVSKLKIDRRIIVFNYLKRFFIYRESHFVS